MNLLHRLTGGRPMRQICFCFTDEVVGKRVYYWEDKLGRPWLAYSAWSWFRMTPLHPPELWRP